MPEAAPPIHVPRQLVIFRVGESLYGLDIASVGEILPYSPTLPVPGAPGGVTGALDVRGVPVPVFDLHWKFAAPAGDPDTMRYIMVNHMEGPVALLAGGVEEVATLDRHEYQTVQAPGETSTLSYLRGCVQRPAGLVLWVDPNRLVPHGLTAAARSRVA